VALILGAWIWSESMTVIGAIGGALIIIGGMAPMILDRSLQRRSDSKPVTSE
jgi:drug/metabolite transporter (DMT)-like permease